VEIPPPQCPLFLFILLIPKQTLRELGAWVPRFVPVSQAPELATAIRRASAAEGRFFINDCRNRRILVMDFDPAACRHAVLSPPHPAVAAVPTSTAALFDPLLLLRAVLSAHKHCLSS
jgi:hypothetical protein